jgi:hypothetical protein
MTADPTSPATGRTPPRAPVAAPSPEAVSPSADGEGTAPDAQVTPLGVRGTLGDSAPGHPPRPGADRQCGTVEPRPAPSRTAPAAACGSSSRGTPPRRVGLREGEAAPSPCPGDGAVPDAPGGEGARPAAPPGGKAAYGAAGLVTAARCLNCEWKAEGDPAATDKAGEKHVRPGHSVATVTAPAERRAA